MRIWLITLGEPLPTDEGSARLLRAGVLAKMLVESGHEVVWWTSTFDHNRKVHRANKDTDVRLDNGVLIRMLHGCGYRSNVSLRRILDHALVARRFARLAPAEPRPEVILCSLPTLELSVAATRYGRAYSVPVVIDVRDLWPDIFLDYVPRGLRPLFNLALGPMWRQAREACRDARAIYGSSPRFVAWGLRLAGREGAALDRSFPFGYVAQPPSVERIAAAKIFWQGEGVNEGSREFIVCFFGTLGGQFDIENVIAAARIMEERALPVRFVICGSGDRLDALRNLAKDVNSVQFPGWVGAAEIWALMRMASVGLAPYLDNAGFSDNYPNKTIEYLSAGLPVVSSLRGYFESFLAESGCGISYPLGNPERLADALSELVVDSARRQEMSRRAAMLFSEKFEAEKVYGEMIDCLREVAATAAPLLKNRIKM